MSTTTAFTVGQLVRARSDGQGLVPDATYRVTAVRVRSLPFGDFVVYVVRAADAARDLEIANGHLVLEAL